MIVEKLVVIDHISYLALQPQPGFSAEIQSGTKPVVYVKKSSQI